MADLNANTRHQFSTLTNYEDKLEKISLRGCLTKNRPLIFALKIDFPYILLIDRYSHGNHKNRFCFVEKCIYDIFSSIQMSLPCRVINEL